MIQDSYIRQIKIQYRTLGLYFCSLLLAGCQTSPDLGENIPLDQLNPPPEQLPAWSDTALGTIGNTVLSMPRKSLQLFRSDKENPSKEKPKPTPSKVSKARPQTNPSPTPPKKSSEIQPIKNNPPKPETKPKAKPKAKPKKKVKPVSRQQTNEIPKESRSPQSANDSAVKNERDVILRGKSIQESPLGPRQPMEL